ncbi:hypothetical protein [Deinococcus aquaticus]|uniref:Zn-finger protein n=1 Tax=Deinococcus aquaticus TaxID=328692 RepID=A0ABY7V6R9_9DEIO|nr:hypothetical protein [Deinococcus aquaticus]WDA60516.1 hypothetical protein M8445_17410 [Deinococcus aquaticus]
MTHAQHVPATPAINMPKVYPRGSGQSILVCDGCQTEQVTHPGFCARCRPLTRCHQGTLRGAAGMLLLLAGGGVASLALCALIIATGLLLLCWGAARLDGHRTTDLLRNARHALLGARPR